MNIRTTAALVAALTALAGCKDLNDGMNILEGKPSTFQLAQEEAALEALAEPEPEVLRLIGYGSMGEEIWTGPGCSPRFRLVICQ